MSERLGFPQKGSKNAIARWLIEQLPSAETFADLFLGGGALTHAAVYSGKYKNFIINDVDGRMVSFFLQCINGEYTTKNHTEWISREQFFENLDDPYVACCWSFGNDGETYLYGRDIEPYKKALHYAVFFKDVSLFSELGVDVPANNEIDGLQERYTAYKRFFRDRKYDLETFERLQGLERLQSLQSLQSHSVDYQDVPLPDGAVIVADIPYYKTNGGRYRKFDHERFYKWAREQDNIFICEYWMPDDFIPFAQKEKIVLSAANSNSIVKNEIVFTNRRTFEKLNAKEKERAALNFSEQINIFDLMGVSDGQN